MNRHRIVVVGGNNMDINATSKNGIVMGDSNPGNVYIGFGGVGRNIAENLARLGQDVRFLTVFGDDEFSKHLMDHAEKTGINIQSSLQMPNTSGCVYVCINNDDGDMTVAINDMALCNCITPEYILSKLDELNAAEAIIVDANLSTETLEAIALHCTPPIFADAVSAKKVDRLISILPRLFALKANRIEIEMLSGITITNEYSMIDAINKLHRMGVHYLFATLGSKGAMASDNKTRVCGPPYAMQVVNTTGCGDAFTAATTIATLEQQNLHQVLQAGLAAAAVTSQTNYAVSDQLSWQKLTDTILAAQKEEAVL